MKTTKWKLALLAWCAMFPFSTAISYGLTEWPLTAHWPLVGRTFCLTCVLIPYMVFGVFPFVNRRFKTWLQPGERQTPTTDNQPTLEATNAENNNPAGSSESGRLLIGLGRNGGGTRTDTTPLLPEIAA